MSRLADELIGMEYRRKLLQRREELSQSGDVLRIDAGIGEKNGKKWAKCGHMRVKLGYCLVEICVSGTNSLVV